MTKTIHLFVDRDEYRATARRRGSAVVDDGRTGMARDADVFITHLAAPRLAKYHLTDADVHALTASAIYATLGGLRYRRSGAT